MSAHSGSDDHEDLTEMFAVLDDLEAQAESAMTADRNDEVADRSRSEYSRVTLASRLMAAVNSEVALEVRGVGLVRGVLDRVGDGWLSMTVHRSEWVVRLDAISTVRSTATGSVPEVAWPAAARLSIGSPLRRIADDGQPCLIHLVDGTRVEGTPVRVGADFVEAEADEGAVVWVAVGAVAAVRRR